MTIKVENKQTMEKFNPFQTGHGVVVSEKYKKKGRGKERLRKEMKESY